jgi:hypothetical protein
VRGTLARTPSRHRKQVPTKVGRYCIGSTQLLTVGKGGVGTIGLAATCGGAPGWRAQRGGKEEEGH